MYKKIISIALINLALSFMYLKQLFYPGPEIALLDVDGILITPFVLFYNFIGIVSLLVILGRRTNLAVKQVRTPVAEKLSYGLLAIVLIAFLVFPIAFLTIRGGNRMASPLLISFLEPLKVKFLYKQSIKSLFVKNLYLFCISFILFFIADLFPKYNAVDGNSWPLYFGFLYFLCIVFLDYYFRNVNFKAVRK